jgi:CHAD domain-containing protein
MSTKIRKITQELTARRTALLVSYNDEDLHQLRVNIRRIRGLLKHHPNPEARRLRREWGKLARRTNAARDWDTMINYAAEVLVPEQFLHLQPLLQDQQAGVHRRVLQGLESYKWSTALTHWNKYLDEAGASYFSQQAAAWGTVQAGKRAVQARQRTLSSGDEGSWHKFRIAIKDLRYALDNLALAGHGMGQ